MLSSVSLSEPLPLRKANACSKKRLPQLSAHTTGPACGGRHVLTSPCSVRACDHVWLGWRFPLVEIGLTDHPQMLTSSGISTLLSHLHKLWGTGWRMDLTKHQLRSKPMQIKLSSSILFQVPARLFPGQHFRNISKEKAPATQYTRGLPVFTEIWDVKSYTNQWIKIF